MEWCCADSNSLPTRLGATWLIDYFIRRLEPQHKPIVLVVCTPAQLKAALKYFNRAQAGIPFANAMTKLRLRTNQKLRLQELLKAIRLRRLHANTIQVVCVKSALTGATERFDVACVKDLRALLRRRFPFTKVRLFADNVEISDSDGMKAELVFVKEADPWRVIALLRDVTTTVSLRIKRHWIKYGRWSDYLHWQANTISEIKSALHALCTMDVPVEVSDALSLIFFGWACMREVGSTIHKVTQTVLLEMGKCLGEVCDASLLRIRKLAIIHINYPIARPGVSVAFARMAARSATIAALIAREIR